MCKIWAKRFSVFGIYVASKFRANPHKELIKPITYFFQICEYVRTTIILFSVFLWLPDLHIISYMYFYVVFMFFLFSSNTSL